MRWSMLGVMLAIIFLIRLDHAMRPTIDWDESLYWFIGWDWLHGGLPYVTAFDHKGPLLYLLPVPMLALFGPEVVALRLFTTAYLLGSMVCLYMFTGRWLKGVPRLFVPAVYGLLFTTSVFGGMASNAELFMMLPVVGAMHCLAVALGKSGRRQMFWLIASGSCCALACLVKQVAFFSAVIVPVVIIGRRWLSDERPVWSRIGRQLVACLVGAVGTCLPFILYWAARGGLHDFFFALVLYNFHYVDSVPFGEAASRLTGFLSYHLRHDPPTMVAAVCLPVLAWKYRKLGPADRRLTLALAAFLVVSLLGIFSPRNMYPHYYLQLAPGISLLIGWSLHQLRPPPRALWWTAAMALAVGLLLCLRPARVGGMRAKFHDAHLREENLVADYIREHTTPQDTIFILGASSIIQLKAERRSPTRYFLWLFHYGRWESGLHIRDATLTTFRDHPPKYFIFKYNPQRVLYLEAFIAEYYHPVQRFGDHYILGLNEGALPEDESR